MPSVEKDESVQRCRVCPTCDGDGVILPLGSRITAKCPDCDGRRLTNAEYKAGRVIPPGECVCPPDFCLGTDSDSGMRVECAACLALDPELPCLRDIPLGGPNA